MDDSSAVGRIIKRSVKPGFHKSNQGGEGRGEQRRGLRTKALMWDLGTRLEC